MRDIEKYLLQFKGESIYYIPNPGNAGDSLIAAATYQTFDRLGLDYHLPNPMFFDATGKIVIYGGGGNLTCATSFSSRVISKLHFQAKKLVILPQTIRRCDILLEQLGDNVDVICRERESYQYVKGFVNSSNLFLMDDMAFGLNVGQLLSAKSSLNFYSEMAVYVFQKVVKSKNSVSLKPILKLLEEKKIDDILSAYIVDDVLNCFRIDGEGTDINIPIDNVDLSEVLAFGVENKRMSYFVTSKVLCFLNEFSEIHTNRLHMAVGGALLGKKVKFHSNNYYKCWSVFEYSMGSRYPNVEWMG